MSICMMKPIVLQYESSVRPIALCTYELSLHTHASLYTDALENPPPKNVPTECQSYIIQITHTVPIRQLSLCRPHILMHLKILGPVFEATRLLSLYCFTCFCRDLIRWRRWYSLSLCAIYSWHKRSIFSLDNAFMLPSVTHIAKPEHTLSSQ